MSTTAVQVYWTIPKDIQAKVRAYATETRAASPSRFVAACLTVALRHLGDVASASPPPAKRFPRYAHGEASIRDWSSTPDALRHATEPRWTIPEHLVEQVTSAARKSGSTSTSRFVATCITVAIEHHLHEVVGELNSTRSSTPSGTP